MASFEMTYSRSSEWVDELAMLSREDQAKIMGGNVARSTMGPDSAACRLTRPS